MSKRKNIRAEWPNGLAGLTANLHIMRNMGESTVMIGLIGVGQRMRYIAKILCEASLDIQVGSVYDPNTESVQACLEEVSPEATVCASVEEMVARDDLDWIFIGSWNSQHAAHSIAALEAGKHVFCEKPLALNLDEAMRMFRAWKQSGRTFALGLVLRYAPLYQTARRMIEEGKIGRILSFEFNEILTFNHGGYIHGDWRRLTKNAGTHLLEKCCHDLDLALWLTDAEPTRVSSFGGCRFFVPENLDQQERIGPDKEGRPAFQTWPGPPGENPFTAEKDIVDHQVAIIEFDQGIRATFHTCCLAALPERRFYILGTEGSLRLDAQTGRLELRRIGWDEPVESHQLDEEEGHTGADKHMCRELAECLAGRRPPAAGFKEGIRSLLLADAIDTAMIEGRVVEVNMDHGGIRSLQGNRLF